MPGEEKSFATNTRTQVTVYRWCPGGSGVYTKLMMIEGINPTVGYPTLSAEIPGTNIRTRQYSLSEGEGVDCNAYSGAYGFSARCWRDGDTSDKRMHVDISKLPVGCTSTSACPGIDSNLYNICNAA